MEFMKLLHSIIRKLIIHINHYAVTEGLSFKNGVSMDEPKRLFDQTSHQTPYNAWFLTLRDHLKQSRHSVNRIGSLVKWLYSKLQSPGYNRLKASGIIGSLRTLLELLKDI